MEIARRSGFGWLKVVEEEEEEEEEEEDYVVYASKPTGMPNARSKSGLSAGVQAR